MCIFFRLIITQTNSNTIESTTDYWIIHVRLLEITLILDWIEQCFTFPPTQLLSIGYMGDGFYRSKDPTNWIKVLKEQITLVVTNLFSVI